MGQVVKFEDVSKLYQRGVELLKNYQFEVEENSAWAKTSNISKNESTKHFTWLSDVLDYFNDNKNQYIRDKIVRKLSNSSKPGSYWLDENPGRLGYSALIKDTKIILNELEKKLDGQLLPLNSGKKYKTKPKLITYNNQSQQIEFDNLSPLSLRNTDNQALLCKVLFKSKKPLVTEQILEKWGWSRARIYNDENKLDKRNRLVVYHAARDINEKINKHNPVYDKSCSNQS